MHDELLRLGALVLVAGLLARGGRRLGLPTVPCFMAAGILLGPGTGGPVLLEPESLELFASLGLVLLLFHLGVEFPVEQVLSSGRQLALAAGSYLALNVSSGFVFGLALGWGTAEALVIAGALGISSSAIATKLLIELRRLANAETPAILGIIVIEDLFLAFYLALLSPVLSDSETAGQLALDVAISFGFLVLLFAVARFGARFVGLLIGSDEDELLAVLTVGLVAVVAGVSESVGVSDAIGALLIGLVVSRTPVRERVERLVLPLRDVFAAVFFIVFGMSIDIADIPSVAVPVLLAVFLTVAVNLGAGLVASRLYGFNQRAASNIGLTVLGRGEFSLILASLALAGGLDPRIGPFVASYVLVLAALSPLLAARSHLLARLIPDRLMTSSFRYVREETMSGSCAHLNQVNVVETDVTSCRECEETGDDWVQLRLCTSCGYVGCCDDSVNRHTTAHVEANRHPVIRSLEPEDTWWFCYPDRRLLHPSARQVPSEATPTDRPG